MIIILDSYVKLHVESVHLLLEDIGATGIPYGALSYGFVNEGVVDLFHQLFKHRTVEDIFIFDEITEKHVFVGALHGTPTSRHELQSNHHIGQHDVKSTHITTAIIDCFSSLIHGYEQLVCLSDSEFLTNSDRRLDVPAPHLCVNVRLPIRFQASHSLEDECFEHRRRT